MKEFIKMHLIGFAVGGCAGYVIGLLITFILNMRWYMIIDIPKDHIDKYIKAYGKEFNQLDILQEECAELIQAISKLKRGKTDTDIHLAVMSIIEEITHVAISSEIACRILYITEDDILNEVNTKTRRLGE